MASVAATIQRGIAAANLSPVSTIFLLVVLAIVSRVIYNIYLHPLAKFPGPWYFSGSDLVFTIFQLRGTSQYLQKVVHDKYGKIVRIGPNTLSFIEPRAWEEIYGYRKGTAALPKDPLFYNEMLLGKDTITLVSDTDAIPIRRAMNTAFSHKNLLDQADMMTVHMESLIRELNKQADTQPKGVDLHKWFTMSMFDINSDFGFGEDMGCVKKGAYHDWVQFVLDYFFAATLIHQCNKFWPLASILMKLVPASVRETQRLHNEAALERVRRRVKLNLDRPDFMYHFGRAAEKEELSTDAIEAQASVLILAGSETSASGLTSATFEVLRHPPVYQNLCRDIRALFASKADITLKDTLNELPYLNAVIWEAMRLHSPLATGFNRVVPKWQNDFTVCGIRLPPTTIVTMNHYAANVSESNFTRPFEFIPERWLGHPDFKDDKLDVVQPFSVGPRNCPGRNFALNNMKLEMVHMIMNFDMELADGMQGWNDRQKLFMGWMQPPLMVNLTKRG